MNTFNQYLMMATSEKGGSGKSTFAIALTDCLRNAGHSIAAYDGNVDVSSLYDTLATRDSNNQPLKMQDPLVGAYPYTVRDESRTVLVDCLRQGHTHMVHDIAGGGLSDVQRLFNDAPDSLYQFVRSIARYDACVVFFHLVTPDISTVASVSKYLDITERLENFTDHVRHVAVLNLQGDRKQPDFPHWYGFTDAEGTAMGGKTRQRLLSGGGAEMAMPAIQDRTMALLKAYKVPFSVGADLPALSATDQSRIFNFLEDFDGALGPEIREIMGLSE